MTEITKLCPTYFMPSEKRAFARGYRDGLDGKEQGRSKSPNAYSRGYWEGVAARPCPHCIMVYGACGYPGPYCDAPCAQEL